VFDDSPREEKLSPGVVFSRQEFSNTASAWLGMISSGMLE
jgi:hypothetical protein